MMVLEAITRIEDKGRISMTDKGQIRYEVPQPRSLEIDEALAVLRQGRSEAIRLLELRETWARWFLFTFMEILLAVNQEGARVLVCGPESIAGPGSRHAMKILGISVDSVSREIPEGYRKC